MLLQKCDISAKPSEGRCVTDYIWSQIKGQRGFKTYTRSGLEQDIRAVAAE